MKGWKTIAFNGGALAVYILGWDQLTQWLSPEMIANLTVLINAGLRFVTTTPVGQKA